MNWTNKITVFNADCMEVMSNYPNGYFDLAIVDPPYGIGEDGKSNHYRDNLANTIKYTPKRWDKNKPTESYFRELFRVSKNQIIWGANHFGSMPSSSGWIVWDKQNGNSDFSDSELAYTSFNRGIRNFCFRWAGMLQGDMKNKEIRIHPTQKPVKLYEWLLTNYSTPNAKILDTHLGSGSHAIAAHYHPNCGEFVGCEIDEDYYDSSFKRFKRETSQVRMF